MKICLSQFRSICFVIRLRGSDCFRGGLRFDFDGLSEEYCD